MRWRWPDLLRTRPASRRLPATPTAPTAARLGVRSRRRADRCGDICEDESARLDPRGYLDNNDATAFFAATGDLLQTGPTLTNVNDIRVILVD